MEEKKVWLAQNYSSMQIERVFSSEKKALKYVKIWCKNIEKADWGYVCYKNKITAIIAPRVEE